LPTIAIGLCTASPGDDGTGASSNEVANSNNYSRVALTGSDWNAAAAGQIDNLNPITFPEASGSWGNVSHYAIYDSPTYGQGNMLIHDALDTQRNVNNGNVVQFAPGDLALAMS